MLNKRSISFAKYSIKRFIPNKIWSVTSEIYQAKRALEFDHKSITQRNSIFEDSVLVIRRRPPGGGLFSNVNHVMQGLEIAQRDNLLPVVDMENYWTSYSQKSKFNDTYNSWEYFFNPVSNLRVVDVKKYRNIELSSGDRINPKSILSDKGLKFVLDRNSINYLHTIFVQYIQLNKICGELVLKVKDFIDWQSKTAGVFYRGTDYVALQPSGHARQPTLKEFMVEVEAKMRTDKSYRLLISTEDPAIRNTLLDSFPNLAYRDFRNQEILVKMLPSGKQVSPQLLNALGYLIETYLLSDSETIVSTIANGSATAILINGNRYIDPVIIDRGVY